MSKSKELVANLTATKDKDLQSAALATVAWISALPPEQTAQFDHYLDQLDKALETMCVMVTKDIVNIPKPE